MPTIKICQKRFNQLMGQEWTLEKLEELGFEYGIEIEDDVQINPQTKDEVKYFRFECTNNRPDLLCEASLTRSLLMYLGKAECPTLKVHPPKLQIIVDRSVPINVNQVEAIRPVVVGAVLRNITFTPETYKAFIDFQEKLHGTFCRNRTVVSIGTHNLDSVEGPFKYVAKDPKQFSFVPLNQTVQVDGHGVMKLYENHKLKQYLPIIRDSPTYPLVLDVKDRVCSLPPIINSDLTKISAQTKNVFIEITATSRPKALICLNTILWGFAGYCEDKWTVQAIQIVYHDHKEVTPVWQDKKFAVKHSNAEKMIGVSLQQTDVQKYLNRMGLSSQKPVDGIYNVVVPAWRSDIIHECDILEDISICYGFQNIVPALPPSQTIGQQQRLNKFTDKLRYEMAYAQYNQALNFALCSKAEMTKMLRLTDDSKLITLQNAKTKEFQTGRLTLISGLLRTAVQNKSNPLPYRLFQVGDCILKCSESDVGAINQRKFAGLLTDEVTAKKGRGLFSNIHGTVDLFLSKIKIKNYKLQKLSNPMFFAEQQAAITYNGVTLGVMGMLHPEVLANFEWGHPVGVFEFCLQTLEKIYFKEK